MSRDGDDLEIAALRERVFNRNALRGFGPFVVAIVLVILMVVLVPTVAPERETVVQTPAPVPTASASPTP
jgi:hypothetical protein